ncbi:hypothetical protein Poli38472_012604 [Pythium oligandrum]|uniref:Uncharacterized protein n=1 Tax=Pythium oligandrum TaxID=41045 RepID=A0A8K1CE94_PYTOL|nr:hypothetical protein Poli38472_012604 [Pythium oligandrum]|eukprot:TMW61413.1 hypothetical protein Poli38472_012604 [Pythium oligandrum]
MPGRGRKPEPWVTWLYKETLDEFRRLQAKGAKVCYGMLRDIARYILRKSKGEFTATSVCGEKNTKTLEERITNTWIRKFCEHHNIVGPASTRRKGGNGINVWLEEAGRDSTPPRRNRPETRSQRKKPPTKPSSPVVIDTTRSQRTEDQGTTEAADQDNRHSYLISWLRDAFEACQRAICEEEDASSVGAASERTALRKIRIKNAIDEAKDAIEAVKQSKDTAVVHWLRRFQRAVDAIDKQVRPLY